jgi:predicted esterase
MVRECDRAPRARAMAMICTALGLAAMIAAPFARSATPTPAPAPAPAPAPTPAPAPAPAPASGLAFVGEQPAPRAHTPESPAWVDAEAMAGRAFVYPPHDESASPRPLTVMLHGMCGHPQSACAPFVDVATSRGWLVCPRGEDPCGGGTRWRLRGSDDAQLVEASVRAIAREHEAEVAASAPRVLVGFSLGGIAAVQIAQASKATYTGLVVIASQVHPDAGLLRRAGVERVVLAAGDLDMTSAPLREDAQVLAASGILARFVSLGRYGHGYPPDMEQRMREPMLWVSESGPERPGSAGSAENGPEQQREPHRAASAGGDSAGAEG